MVSIDGADKLTQQLEELARKIEQLKGEHVIPVTDLLTDSFISRCTRFFSAIEMFEAGGFRIESQEDFVALQNDDEWDRFISANSRFDGWRKMRTAAALEWTKKELGFQ